MTDKAQTRILVVTMDEMGHIGPTLWLTERLVQQGYSVKMMMPSLELGEYAGSTGIEVLTPKDIGLCEDLPYPSGVRALAHGEFTDVFSSMPFDLLLVNAPLWPVAPAARRAGIPAIIFWTSLPMEMGARAPIMLDADTDGKPRWRWKAFRTTATFRVLLAIARIRSSLGGDEKAMAYPANPKMKALATLGDYKRICRGLTSPLGYPQGRLRHNQVVCPIEWTEIILGPRSIDIGRDWLPWRHYAGTAVAPVSRQNDIPATARKQSVLVAVGSKGALYDPKVLTKLLENIYTVAERLSDVQFYVSMPDNIRESVHSPCPANVEVRRFLPQAQLLMKVDAFVSHCGFGSLKESLVAGVPMLALPFEADQPKNAITVEIHGIGIRRAPTLSAKELEADLRALLTPDSTYLRVAQQWSERLGDKQESAEALELIAAIVEREISDCPHLAPAERRP